jgi:hypothetical protein
MYFLSKMKLNIKLQVTHLQWFVPIGHFVDLFAIVYLIKLQPPLY